MKIKHGIKQWLQAKAGGSDGRRVEVQVDYPKEGEVVTHATYSIRIGAVPEAIHVDVSINGGPWRPCRESLGLWWFDWDRYGSGHYTVRARIQKERQQIAVSPERRFTVKLPGDTPPPPPATTPDPR